jgi:hypothetical protein
MICALTVILMGVTLGLVAKSLEQRLIDVLKQVNVLHVDKKNAYVNHTKEG